MGQGKVVQGGHGLAWYGIVARLGSAWLCQAVFGEVRHSSKARCSLARQGWAGSVVVWYGLVARHGEDRCGRAMFGFARRG